MIPSPILFPIIQTSHFYSGPPCLLAMKIGAVCLGLALHTGFSSRGGLRSELVLLGKWSSGPFKVWGTGGAQNFPSPYTLPS